MHINLSKIDLSDYQYHLPDERIAKHPLSNRSDSRLLFYRDGKTEHRLFRELPELIPQQASLFFNNTRVIPARLHFRKAGGALIEVFLLSPVDATVPIHEAMTAPPPALWRCVIGNKKRWKSGIALEKVIDDGKGGIALRAELTDHDENIVRLSWDRSDVGLAELLELAGAVPLPPYLKRAPLPEDKPRYQTVYSEKKGAVAAPTAGLHFTSEIIDSLRNKGRDINYLTLHVGAGTFQPIKEANVLEHPMHNEQIIVTGQNIDAMLNKRYAIAVGTTAMRTMESVYWYGVKLLKGRSPEFRIGKLAPYEEPEGALPSAEQALSAVKEYMEKKRLAELVGETEIFIVPGYRFMVCNGLVTNFHLPASTLILLVAAFIGPDWRAVYNAALENGYRFLSYGDASLLLK